MINLNGKATRVEKVLYDVSLLDFIRDQAMLKGTKFGCGQGFCGSCTVHLDGIAQRACQLKMSEVRGHKVTTIEGLSALTDDEGLHPVQRAWIAEAVPQCGYCQPGQIMTAAALLAANPTPGDEEIRAGMSGNLCRCGTYSRIHRAVARAAQER